MSESLVTVRELHKVFQRGGQRIDVLEGVNLDIPEGDFLALMGPSGSGKTTLLNLIAGIDSPTRGRIVVGGRDIATMGQTELARWRSSTVGFIFQLYNLLPVLSAFENVELPLLLTHLKKAERKKHVETALSIVGLSDSWATSVPATLTCPEVGRSIPAIRFSSVVLPEPDGPMRARISSALLASRSPVGSSATSTLGSATIARAMATRCSCPPESCRGK